MFIIHCMTYREMTVVVETLKLSEMYGYVIPQRPNGFDFKAYNIVCSRDKISRYEALEYFFSIYKEASVPEIANLALSGKLFQIHDDKGFFNHTFWIERMILKYI